MIPSGTTKNSWRQKNSQREKREGHTPKAVQSAPLPRAAGLPGVGVHQDAGRELSPDQNNKSRFSHCSNTGAYRQERSPADEAGRKQSRPLDPQATAPYRDEEAER